VVESITAPILFDLQQLVNHQDGWPVGPAGPQSARNDWHSGRQAGRMAVMVFLVAAKIKTVVTPWLVSCIKVGVRELECLPALSQAQGH
jgi:hypothetical protein